MHGSVLQSVYIIVDDGELDVEASIILRRAVLSGRETFEFFAEIFDYVVELKLHVYQYIQVDFFVIVNYVYLRFLDGFFIFIFLRDLFIFFE